MVPMFVWQYTLFIYANNFEKDGGGGEPVHALLLMICLLLFMLFRVALLTASDKDSNYYQVHH